ncbi:MAG: VIT domain-containing protein [Planctomycetota bacterium]|nr:VIT domain-containing protein [Planctomycetota bacterium]
MRHALCRSPFLAAFLALFALLLVPAAALADGLIIINVPDDVVVLPRPRPTFPGSRPVYRFAPLEVRKHQVDVAIQDQVAVTKVDQIFYNPSSQRLEGTYLFPIPEGANIDKFTMEINGKETDAELLSADKARSIYEEIDRKTRDPALLEYVGRGLFKVRIFPIEPNSEKRIRLRYTQVLKSDSGLVSYVYPLNTEKFSAKPIENVSLRIEVNASRPIKSVYCPSHEVEIRRPDPKQAVIGFEAKNVKPDTDFQIFFAPQKPDGNDIDLNLLTFADPGEQGADKAGGSGGYFMLVASPGLLADPKKIVKRDLVFVLDTSGSMAGPKMEQAKRAMLFCLANLNAGDRFQVLRFSTDVEPLFPSPLEASKENIGKAREFVEGLKPIGGTAIADALKQALAPVRDVPPDAGRPYVVIFLTDGQPTIGETSEEAILKLVESRVARSDDPVGAARIFCFGIGTDVNTRLLDSIASKTGGTCQYVLPNEDLEIKLSNFYGKFSQPVLAKVKLSVSNVRVSRMYPNPLPDLFQGDQLILLGRYDGTGHAAIKLEGDVNGKAKTFTTEIAFPERANQHEFIPRLWAVRRVGHLLEEIRHHGENAELRGEATELARRYGIVTPYTSYLIVEDEARRGVPLTMQTNSSLGRDGALREDAKDLYYRAQRDLSGAEAVAGARMTGRMKGANNAPMSSAAADTLSDYAMADSEHAAKKSETSGGSSVGRLGRGGGKVVHGGTDTDAPATPTAAPATQPAQGWAQQQVRVVNNRAFYQNGPQWVDSQVQANAKATRIAMKFGSAEYFELVKKHPEAAAWFSVDSNLQLVLDDKIYDITE